MFTCTYTCTYAHTHIIHTYISSHIHTCIHTQVLSSWNIVHFFEGYQRLPMTWTQRSCAWRWMRWYDRQKWWYTALNRYFLGNGNQTHPEHSWRVRFWQNKRQWHVYADKHFDKHRMYTLIAHAMQEFMSPLGSGSSLDGNLTRPVDPTNDRNPWQVSTLKVPKWKIFVPRWVAGEVAEQQYLMFESCCLIDFCLRHSRHSRYRCWGIP